MTRLEPGNALLPERVPVTVRIVFGGSPSITRSWRVTCVPGFFTSRLSPRLATAVLADLGGAALGCDTADGGFALLTCAAVGFLICFAPRIARTALIALAAPLATRIIAPPGSANNINSLITSPAVSPPAICLSAPLVRLRGFLAMITP